MMGFPGGASGEETPYHCSRHKTCEFNPWVGKEESTATHAGILAWRIPWTEKPGRLQSMRSPTLGHN